MSAETLTERERVGQVAAMLAEAAERLAAIASRTDEGAER